MELFVKYEENLERNYVFSNQIQSTNIKNTVSLQLGFNLIISDWGKVKYISVHKAHCTFKTSAHYYAN